jgi:hypothetical protein
MRKALFQGLISIFLGNDEQEARQNTESFDTTGIQKVLLPSFAEAPSLGENSDTE